MKIDRGQLLAKLAEAQKDGYNYLVKITAVDYVANLEAVYILRNIGEGKDETFEVDLANDDLWLPTVIDHFRAADWYEREMSEMFGIEIRGRVTKRLLLEKWDGADPPLRKSFIWDAPYRSK